MAATALSISVSSTPPTTAVSSISSFTRGSLPIHRICRLGSRSYGRSGSATAARSSAAHSSTSSAALDGTYLDTAVEPDSKLGHNKLSADPSSNVVLRVASKTESAIEGERPKWMQISSLDELKTKVGHVIVMILLVKMFEHSKMANIATGMDLVSYSICIFLSPASLYILHNLHRHE